MPDLVPIEGPVGFAALNELQSRLAADRSDDFPAAIARSLRSDPGNPYAIETCIRAAAAHYALPWPGNQRDEFITTMHRGAVTTKGADALAVLALSIADAIDAHLDSPIHATFVDEPDYSTWPPEPGKDGAAVHVPKELACKGDPPIGGMGPVGFRYIETTVRDYAAANRAAKGGPPPSYGDRPAPSKGEVDRAAAALKKVGTEVVEELLSTRVKSVPEPDHYQEFLEVGLRNFNDDTRKGPRALQDIAQIVIDAIDNGNVDFTIVGYTTDATGDYAVEPTATGCVVLVPKGLDCQSDPLPDKSTRKD